MTEYAFGIGSLFGKRTDTAVQGTSEFGTIKEVDIDLSFAVKELTGQFQAPVALARGAMKITGKAKAALISSPAFNSIFFGQTVATGTVLTQYRELGTPASNIITVANAANFVADFGVYNANTGVRQGRVSSAPTSGAYSVNEATGVYTFPSGTVTPMLISYQYNASASGQNVAIANQLMGSQPTFTMLLSESYNGKILNLQLNAVICPKLVMNFKNEDFMIPEFDFQASADSSGNIGTIWTSE